MRRQQRRCILQGGKQAANERQEWRDRNKEIEVGKWSERDGKTALVRSERWWFVRKGESDGERGGS